MNVYNNNVEYVINHTVIVAPTSHIVIVNQSGPVVYRHERKVHVITPGQTTMNPTVYNTGVCFVPQMSQNENHAVVHMSRELTQADILNRMFGLRG